MPVLLEAVITGLNLRDDGLYVDGTFGRGGHSLAILKRLGPTGRLLAIDRDPQAIATAADALKSDPRFELAQGEFSELKEHAIKRNVLGKVDGLLLDLGVSSPQLDEAERGFSFQSDGPLDMRMDPTSGESAASWLARVKEQELKKVLYAFGEERNAGRIAKAIVTARALQPILRTSQLADIVAAGTYPELVIADWAGYAKHQDPWFANDGIHLRREGPWAAADYISRKLAFLEDRACPQPDRPGVPIADPCPDPDVMGPTIDLRDLYPIGEPNPTTGFQMEWAGHSSWPSPAWWER